MKTTGIRIEVPQNLYERLQAEQEQRRLKTGKKPALAAIILEFCSKTLDLNPNAHSDVHSVHDSVHRIEHSKATDYDNEKRLKHWEDKLIAFNKTLQEREKNVKNEEKEVFKEKMDVFDLRTKVMDEREKAHQKALAATEMIFEKTLLQNELKQKNERIEYLSKELSFIKDKLLATLKGQSKNDSNSFWEQIKPYLPYIGGVIALLATYLIANKADKPSLPPILKELAGVFDGLSEKDKQALGEKLNHYAKQHTSPVNETQTLHDRFAQAKKK